MLPCRRGSGSSGVRRPVGRQRRAIACSYSRTASPLCSGCRNSFTDILRAILLSLEVLIEDPELQINGFLLIIDWSNFSFKQASKLTPSILRLAIEGLQVCAMKGHHETVCDKVLFSYCNPSNICLFERKKKTEFTRDILCFYLGLNLHVWGLFCFFF